MRQRSGCERCGHRENHRFKGVKHDVIGTPWRPTPPTSSRPFCARLARSTSSANGFQQQQQDPTSAQLTTSRSRSYLPPCLVARAGRKHLPVVTPKSHTRRSVTKIPTFGPRKSVRSTDPVGGVLGALASENSQADY